MKNQFKLNYQQKKELAEWIANKNKGAVTGSIMLRERCCELGREPNDIDIVVSESLGVDDIELPPFIYEKEEKKGEDGYSVLARCWYFDTKIEFIADDYALKRASKVGFDAKYCMVDDLLAAKKEYVEKDEDADYIEKSKRDIDIIEEYQKQFPIVKYRVVFNGYLEKLVSNSKAGKDYVFSLIGLMDCNMFEEWKIKEDNNITSNLFQILSEDSISNLYTDFEEAKKVSKERWDKEVAPNALYRVAHYFDDMFEGYVTEPLSKRDAFAKLDDYRKKNVRYLNNYDVVKVEE